MGQQLRRLLFLFLFFFATWFCTTIDLTNSDKILVNQLMICKYVIAQMRQANQANGPFVQASQAGKSNRSVSESLSLSHSKCRIIASFRNSPNMSLIFYPSVIDHFLAEREFSCSIAKL